MADDEQDKEQKTEEPTQKRLEEAMKKGNVPTSREVSSFLILSVLAFTVAWMSPTILRNAASLLAPFITDAGTLPTDPTSLGHLLMHVAFGGLLVIAGPLVAGIAAALLAGFLQNGLVFSAEPLMPRLDKISPLEGISRLFSMRTLAEFIKSLLKITVIAAVAFLAVWPLMPHIIQLPNSSVEGLLVFLKLLASRMTIGVAVFMFFIAVFDTLWQRFQYTKSMRMTRQEVKDEFKQSEGDPMIKARLRRLRVERARKRMMTAVPKADVVITNPTHFAVALQYDGQKMKAPLLIAKGQDLIALKIREVAKEHNIPIVENPPLARALYDTTDIDQEIPFSHYEAVAKVISYVYGLKGKKLKR